ncbi:MAG: glycosyltransferase family 4 protein [Firmicutes bacterium]|nr:glycosyltransferase family 4 protein [Bacillota bacterium]
MPQLLLDKADILFLPNHLAPFWPGGPPVVTTIFDLAFLKFPNYFPRRSRQTLKRNTQHAVHRASLVLTISEATRQDILATYGVSPEKVAVTHCGVDTVRFRPLIDPGAIEEVRRRYRLPNNFFLYVGALQPRKNLLGLLEAYTLARRAGCSWPLVIAGPRAWLWEETMRKIQETEGAIYLDYVPADDLPAIYALAGAFLYVPFYEGFGLPVLEAMACGTPVITSNVSALPEVAGDAALLVDPYDIPAVARAIWDVHGDPVLRQRMREKGLSRSREFSWENTARETLRLLEAARGGNKGEGA